ncbi:MAG: hypothetical protein AAFQ67_05450, partial [Pseudomonadota bacterium]
MGLKLGAWTRWSGVIGGAAILFTAGCDRRDERVENARELVRASVEQVTGEDVAPVTAAAAMERASLAQRALAPGRSEIERAGARSRFVIGSVIAKPKEITETRARLAQPQFRNLESIDAEDAVGGEEESASETAPIRRRVTRKELRELRKDRLEQWEIDVQLDAQSKMRETMAKFGIGGEIYTSRDGHMTIDFVEPTQLRERIDRDELWTKRPSLERIKPKRLEAVIARRKRWADYTERACPEDPSPNAMQDDRALATYCLVKALRASDEFEYVEEDFMFDHQFARRPVNEPPATVAPNDPLWSLQWHFQSNGDEEDQSKGGAGFVDFWTKRGEKGSDDVVVAVVDTGLELDHPDILTSPNVANGWDMVSDPVIGNDGDGRDSNPDDPGDICDPDDPFAENSFHGTHVAG